jgi:hypothetical protein
MTSELVRRLELVVKPNPAPNEGPNALAESILTAVKALLSFLLMVLGAGVAQADVRISVRDVSGLASLEYECTAGELIRAFALDVRTDRGQILGVANYFRGDCKAGATGYGIFPASLRSHSLIVNGTNIDWNVSDYSPLAVVADDPAGTLPGLNSGGITLEFGALWDPNRPATWPETAGRLCTMTLSQAAQVSVAPNASRGGVVSANSGSAVTAVFIGAAVGPAITTTTMTNGVLNLRFQGGELQAAPTLEGPWTPTGDQDGIHAEPLGPDRARFYRVRATP